MGARVTDERTQGEHFVPMLRELGVRVHAPHVVDVEGAEHAFAAFLPDFGGKRGMVIIFRNDPRGGELIDEARRQGLWHSVLYENATISLDDVKEAIRDWGYFGPPELRPAWYTGQA